MEYEDFVLQLEASPVGGYTVQVVSSPAGEGRGRCEIPLSVQEVGRVAVGVALAVDAGRQRDVLSASRRTAMGRELKELGDRLFREVFSGQIRSRYDQSMGWLGEREDCGLRIKIRLVLDDPAVVRLHTLPWEYLFRAEDRAFLALGRRTSIIRYLELPLPGKRPPLPPPLRILVAMPEPAGLPPLDFQRERERIQSAWGHGGAEIVFLEGTTLEGLRGALLSGSFHVLHFMGHGEFDPSTGKGCLLLEDGFGRPCSVGGEVLADHLRDCASLRLVFLNVCHTARAAAAGPFSGVAAALLLAGVPAVVAMQFPISDLAAVAFSEEFYRRLAAGDPVDAAIAEGRLALHRRWPGTSEWGTPVLFLRSPDGRILEKAGEKPLTTATIEGHRRVSGIVAAGLLAVLLAAVALWERGAGPTSLDVSASPQVLEERSQRQSQDLGEPHATIPHDQTRFGQASKSRTDPPKRSSSRDLSPVETAVVRTPRKHLVADGEAVFLDEINASVTAQFLSLYGQDMIRLSLTPAGSSALQQPPVFGPQTIQFEAGDKRYLLTLSDVSWTSRTLRVTPSSVPL